MNEGEPSTSQTEVLVDVHANNKWDPQKFLRRNDLIEEFEKIESRRKSDTVSIFRVPTHLSSSYVSACKPTYISIGPYNRGEHNRGEPNKLRFMEAYKLHYMYELWRRISSGRWQIKEFIDLLHTEMKKNESRARSCYSDSINMESDEFVEMMLLDGCFIIEFMFKIDETTPPVVDETTPPVVSTRYGWTFVLRDLLLLENQLPFFVLESIYGMVDNSDGPRNNLRPYMECGLIEKLLQLFRLERLLFVDHLLTPLFEMLPAELELQQPPDHLLHLFHLSLIGHDDHTHTQPRRHLFYRKATELELSGVKFKTKDDGRLLHVSFHNGILEMSPLTLNETSSIYLRNFVALEQCQEKYGLHFTSYMFFVDNLVDSNKDVELLIKRGIFYNDMGSNEVVVKHFFDRFSNEIVTDSTCNHLYDTLQEMEKYCEKPWAKWKATLSRDYFNNPWSILSFFAAVLLLALTMLQASGTIYRYIKN